VEHLDNFLAHLDLHGTPDEVVCRAFPLTMVGSAQDWIRKLSPRSINNFDDLGRIFITQFMAGVMRKKPSGSLIYIRQGPKELLKDYLAHFNQEKLATESRTKEFVYCPLFQGIRKDGPLMADLARKSPQNLQEFMDRVDEFINQEETLQALLGANTSRASSSGEKKEQKGAQKAVEQKPRKKFKDYDWTPLNVLLNEVLMEIKKDPMY
jgi:hypothetical protein